MIDLICNICPLKIMSNLLIVVTGINNKVVKAFFFQLFYCYFCLKIDLSLTASLKMSGATMLQISLLLPSSRNTQRRVFVNQTVFCQCSLTRETEKGGGTEKNCSSARQLMPGRQFFTEYVQDRKCRASHACFGKRPRSTLSQNRKLFHKLFHL